ncbi:ABC transporter permease [Kitasatospora sp. NPDC052896]|uniref:ABC transporter permease n=1 Tax=Kitasatospora sp. NPDC052896 TaxID=3364061 RepID=UPI0037C8377C
MNGLAGTATLFRLALRRDRVMLPAWVAFLTAAVASTAYSFHRLYPNPAAREQLAASLVSNSSLRALYGPLNDPSTIGGITAWRMGVFGPALAGLMSILLVVRHTRAEEEDGRLELVGAGAVGRGAALTAALLTALGANLLLAPLVTAVLLAYGQHWAGSLAFGVAIAACGVVLAAVAAVTAQLTETGRAATGWATTLLGLAYVLRAGGDSGPQWLSRLSPIGWSEWIAPFAADRWWVLAVPLTCAAVLTCGAYLLVAHRDLGAGLLPQRAGRAVALPALRTPLALAWRLQRGSLYGWCVGLAVVGTVIGSTSKGVLQLIEHNPELARILSTTDGQQTIVDTYLSTAMGLIGMVCAGYAVHAVLRLRGEETGGRAEPVLATAVSRLRWAVGHLLYPLLGSALLLAVSGLAAGLAKGVVLRNGAGSHGSVREVVAGALVQLPAVWLTAAAATALLGLLPRWSTLGWGVLAFFVLVGWLGPALQLGQWLLDLSPFTHLPRLPGGPFKAQPLLWQSLLSALLTAAGLLGLRHRDLG